jgi:hypothetical protein
MMQAEVVDDFIVAAPRPIACARYSKQHSDGSLYIETGFVLCHAFED